MRKVVLYIAMSVDGYIADSEGKVDWLIGDFSDNDNIGHFSTFYNSIDTVIMGWNTYDQIVNELSIDNWSYRGKQSYVFTHRKMKNKEDVSFCNDSIDKFIHYLKQKEGKNIWVCGGAKIINQLIKDDLIDVFCISVIPTILGCGVSLFSTFSNEKKLKLITTSSYNGIVDLVYKKR